MSRQDEVRTAPPPESAEPPSSPAVAAGRRGGMVASFKNVLKHSSIYSAGEILRKVISFFMVPIYLRMLTAADYGVQEVISLTMGLVSMIFSARLTSGLLRYYYEYKDAADRRRLVSSVLIFINLLAFALAAALCFAGDLFSAAFFRGARDYGHLFTLAFIAMGFEFGATLCFTYLRILEKSVLFVAISFLQCVVGVVLNIVFLVQLGWGVTGIFQSMVYSNAVVCLILLGYCFKRSGVAIDWTMVWKVVKFSLPLVPASLLIFVQNKSPAILLNYLLPEATHKELVGVYSLAGKFGLLIGTFVGSPFLMAWGPKRLDLYMNSPDWKEINERILVYVTLLLVFIGFAVSVSIKEILIVLAPAGPFREAAAIVPLMVLGHIFYVLYYVVDVSFFVLKKTIWYVVINFTAAVATVVLNVLLIPHFGYTAAAYVSAASFLICPALALAISQRYCRLDYDYVRLAKIFIVGGSLFAVSTLIDTGSFAFDVALKSVLIAGFPAALLVIGFADKKEIEFLRRRLKRTSA